MSLYMDYLKLAASIPRQINNALSNIDLKNVTLTDITCIDDCEKDTEFKPFMCEYGPDHEIRVIEFENAITMLTEQH